MFNPRAWIVIPLTVLAACAGQSTTLVEAGPSSTSSSTTIPVETTTTSTTLPPTTTEAPTTTAPTETTVAAAAVRAPRTPVTAPAATDDVSVPEPEEEAPTTTTAPRKPAGTAWVALYVNQGWPISLEPCGGDLPPCAVKRIESGGDYNAINRRGCGGRGCFGAWQFDPTTWNGYGGYVLPTDAPPEVQDAKAAETWAGGKGCSQWSGPGWSGCGYR